MPLYDFYCNCGYEGERLAAMNTEIACPICEAILHKAIGSNIMVKMKGEGGYPSRRKQIFNTTYRKHPNLT